MRKDALAKPQSLPPSAAARYRDPQLRRDKRSWRGEYVPLPEPKTARRHLLDAGFDQNLLISLD
jgi:hypothetical protein